MIAVLQEGDEVTVLPPYDNDPYILSFQHYGVVVDSMEGGYVVALEATYPPDQRFGPFPESRLAKGWKDQNGKWRVP